MRSGGLSSLLAVSQHKAAAASVATLDMPCAGQNLSADLQGESSSFSSRGFSQALSIPSSSLGCKERSPVSVFSIDPSVRMAAASPRIGSLQRSEHNHSSSVEGTARPKRRASLDYSGNPQPKHRSVGFAVKKENQCDSRLSNFPTTAQPEAKISRRSALRSGLASIQGVVDSMSDLSLQAAGSARVPSEDKVAWARDEVLRLVREGKGLSLAPLREQSVLPLTFLHEAMSPEITEGDLLARAQAQYPVFNDKLVQMAFNVAAIAHQDQVRTFPTERSSYCSADLCMTFTRFIVLLFC